MPFRSEKQRRWMFLHHPEMAKRWAKHTPKGTKLPMYVKKKVREALEERGLLIESPDLSTLKKNRRPLDDKERAAVMKAGAVWHMGANGSESPAVWKAVANGKTWYVSNTHRCYQCKPTLKAAIQAYHDVVKDTA